MLSLWFPYCESRLIVSESDIWWQKFGTNLGHNFYAQRPSDVTRKRAASRNGFVFYASLITLPNPPFSCEL